MLVVVEAGLQNPNRVLQIASGCWYSVHGDELRHGDAKQKITTFRPNLLDVPSMHTTRFLGSAFGCRGAVDLMHLVELRRSTGLPTTSPSKTVVGTIDGMKRLVLRTMRLGVGLVKSRHLNQS
ncbi:hypothetical protein PAXINDRAFT_104242 [Paxillus involutus ATCC 200175]|uniref:Uncharacterized protein n=1 Tax=Paxillus involutus ATCC 200175 TaxID=664439 RepID=A0A0C9SYZ6_PAXIN|nr:hypothetical protein PAXINDRAFT_104242 [Paxillus involutus ATCC 200175]